MKFILAGNYREFEDWCRENNTPPIKVVFLNSKEKLMGFHDIELIKYGTWYNNPMANSLEILCLERKTKEKLKDLK